MGFKSMADDGKQPPDSTARMPGVGDDDATRVRPAVNAERLRAAYEDSTRTIPAAGGSDDRWAGSASVRPTAASDEPAGYEYADDVVEPQPNWLRPVLFGFVGLLLLGVLLTGLWLIFTADDEPPPPQASAPPATSAAPVPSARTTVKPTSAPPTSEAPVTVEIPLDIVGLSEDEARQRLTDLGLRVQVTRRPDATMAPGTVLETNPQPGSQVEPNSVVRIVVAVEPPRPSGDTSSGRG
jgi:hypothetical protein